MNSRLDQERIVANVRLLRTLRGWSQVELARRLMKCGVANVDGRQMYQPTVSGLERGLLRLSEDVVEGLARVFGIPSFMLRASAVSTAETAEMAGQLRAMADRLATGSEPRGHRLATVTSIG